MILDTIVAATKARVAKLKESVPLELIKAKAEVIARAELTRQGGQFPFDFEKALRAGSMNFICEVKKASPSKGVIAEDFPYLAIAEDYEKAGAAAISVLTEPEFSKGPIHTSQRLPRQYRFRCCVKILLSTAIRYMRPK